MTSVEFLVVQGSETSSESSQPSRRSSRGKARAEKIAGSPLSKSSQSCRTETSVLCKSKPWLCIK